MSILKFKNFIFIILAILVAIFVMLPEQIKEERQRLNLLNFSGSKNVANLNVNFNINSSHDTINAPISTTVVQPTPITPSQNAPLPEKIILSGVPFISQAPFGDWQNPHQQNGCEETALLMAWHWLNDDDITDKAKMLDEILAFAEYGKKTMGTYHDTSVADTMELGRQFFDLQNMWSENDVNLEKIKEYIALGRLVITPINGQCLKNPYYSGAGPERHMIVIIGYDDNDTNFITHDPGTRRGAFYSYNYDHFISCIRDYPTGDNLPITEIQKNMIIISK